MYKERYVFQKLDSMYLHYIDRDPYRQISTNSDTLTPKKSTTLLSLACISMKHIQQPFFHSIKV